MNYGKNKKHDIWRYKVSEGYQKYILIVTFTNAFIQSKVGML